MKQDEMAWKMKLQEMSKDEPDVNIRKQLILQNPHFTSLLETLKNTDWSQTPIYMHYLRNRRYIHDNDQIYSELELQYNISYLNKLSDDIQREEELQLVDQFYQKTILTLEELMR